MFAHRLIAAPLGFGHFAGRRLQSLGHGHRRIRSGPLAVGVFLHRQPLPPGQVLAVKERRETGRRDVLFVLSAGRQRKRNECDESGGKAGEHEAGSNKVGDEKHYRWRPIVTCNPPSVLRLPTTDSLADSTVTLLARFRGLSTSQPRRIAM